ncbi:MAG: adenylyltransferase/cytidyltransferase family protein [Candidatus Pacebacteria bacterium]|mgnify:FL=1|jgi:cytidyltransferase-like protein|nr:adenylyltransferase/cytidyltransferase family protein [Candidatus Paceibacterota bacterium]MBT4652804.1 adenylyltransferase/cytidyltransferase family protein [Candidatus Paceibacterota bacterium]MBT6755792.1 adenylyltransferase/cytidyltransferase family protein [Candidatus Paceibacterota bacterium]MBT6921766.1 adenylyltransferase/cytidyltransferase family protein [Candidatus Paceibacterota bacterium]
MNTSTQEKLVLAAVTYSAQFSHPLTEIEIIERLLQPRFLDFLGDDDSEFTSQKTKTKQKSDKKDLANFSRNDFSKAITSLVKKKKIFKKGSLYTLPFTKDAFLMSGDGRKNEITKEYKEKIIKELALISEKIPWVLGVVLTGSYAAGVVVDKDDLDFLVITKKNRLWLTRLLFLVISFLKGRRPHLPGGDISHSWDFNFWLDETSLVLPRKKQGIYEAYELLQTRWILDKENTKEYFFRKNKWVDDYFLFSKLLKIETKSSKMNGKKDKLSEMKLSFIADVGEKILEALEDLSFFIQVSYREKKHGKQSVTKNSAFFHSAKTKTMILDKWKEIYKQALGNQSEVISKKLKKQKETKVLVTGVFDVLHQEHKKFLQAAKRAGDYLVIGLESDFRVKKIKGVQRPVFTQDKRKKNLEKWHIADEIFILPSKFGSIKDHLSLIKKVNPDILAVSEHTSHLARKRKILKKIGGEVRVVRNHNPDFSTTKSLQKSNIS